MKTGSVEYLFARNILMAPNPLLAYSQVLKGPSIVIQDKVTNEIGGDPARIL